MSTWKPSKESQEKCLTTRVLTQIQTFEWVGGRQIAIWEMSI